MFGLQEQLKHYDMVRQRIAANGKAEYDAPPQALLPYERPTARMRVPTVAEIDAARAIRKFGRDSIPESIDAKAKADRIINEVAAQRHVKISDIHGHRRFTEIMHARREVCWRLAKELGWSQLRIGRYLNKDHSSVRYAVIAYEKELQK